MTESETRERLVRIETKLDGIVDANVRGDGIHADFEQRLRRLEKWMFFLTGAAATLGSASGAAVSKLLG